MATPFSRTTRALAADSPRLALLAWALALLALAAWSLWFAFGRVTLVELSRRARLEAQAAPHALVADLPGKLATTALVIGRSVRAGEVLATLDAGRLQAQVQEEQARQAAIAPRLAALRQEIAALAQAQASDQRATAAAVQAAQARVRESGAAADLAQDTESRLNAERGTGSIAEIDALRAQADARRQRSATEALGADARRLALDADTRGLQTQARIRALERDAAALDGEAATGRATLARLAREIDRHQLRAPVAGTIAEVSPLAPGAFVAEGQKLATLVPAGELLLVADFAPGTALGRIIPGQHASLRLDGYPWAQYGSVDATVLRVAGELRDGLLRVELQPLPPATDSAHPGPPLRHGLAGSVEVTVERVSPAVLALRAAGQLATGSAAPVAEPAPIPSPAAR